MKKCVLCLIFILFILAQSITVIAERLNIEEMENAKDVILVNEWNYAIPYELLKNNSYIVLANREHLLSDDYIPNDLVKITVRKISSDPILMRETAAMALKSLFDDAKTSGIHLYAHSGYRSYRTQKTMYYNRLDKNGGKDDGVVAFPGSSDHQTGLGIDVINKAGIGKRFTSAFADTKEGKWLAEHCWEYGFIIRYQKDKEHITNIIYEPWHLRYVGVMVAQYMHEMNYCLEEFYDEWTQKVSQFENN